MTVSTLKKYKFLLLYGFYLLNIDLVLFFIKYNPLKKIFDRKFFDKWRAAEFADLDAHFEAEARSLDFFQSSFTIEFIGLILFIYQVPLFFLLGFPIVENKLYPLGIAVVVSFITSTIQIIFLMREDKTDKVLFSRYQSYDSDQKRVIKILTLIFSIFSFFWAWGVFKLLITFHGNNW